MSREELAAVLGEVADGLLEKSRRAEPAVTRDLKEIASRQGGRLEGLDYRLKGKDLMVCKISYTTSSRGI